MKSSLIVFLQYRVFSISYWNKSRELPTILLMGWTYSKSDFCVTLLYGPNKFSPLYDRKKSWFHPIWNLILKNVCSPFNWKKANKFHIHKRIFFGSHPLDGFLVAIISLPEQTIIVDNSRIKTRILNPWVIHILM